MDTPLKQWRHGQKLTQRALAARLGISPTILIAVETGQEPLIGKLRSALEAVDATLVNRQDRFWRNSQKQEQAA